MITEEQLIAAGYRKFKASPFKAHAIALYQRWIRNETTKFYAINFWEYAPIMPDLPRVFEAEVRLYTPGDDQTGFDLAISVVKHPQQETIESVEAFFRKAFHVLGCRPDPNNQP